MKTKKTWGYWKSWENLEREMRAVIDKLGRFPTLQEFNAIGRADLQNGCRHHGGLNEVRRRMNFQLVRRDVGYLQKLENVMGEIETIKAAHPELNGNLPSSRWFQQNGYSYLSRAIYKYHGGYRDFRQKLGEEQLQRAGNTWKSLDYTIQETLRYMAEKGYVELPSGGRIRQDGFDALLGAIFKYHGGIDAFRDILRLYRGESSKGELLEMIADKYLGEKDETA